MKREVIAELLDEDLGTPQEIASSLDDLRHINGWFGEHTKLSGARWIVQRLLGKPLDDDTAHWVYVGDSTNDQLMFAHFPLSVGVANLMHFADQLHTWPAYITAGERGHGFAEVASTLLRVQGR